MRECVNTGRVESGRVGSNPVESGRVGSGRIGSNPVESDRVGSDRIGSDRVGSQDSCRVKDLDAAFLIFASWAAMIGLDGCYFALGNECRKVVLFVKGHRAIYNAFRHELEKKRLLGQRLVKNCPGDGLNTPSSSLSIVICCTYVFRLF